MGVRIWRAAIIGYCQVAKPGIMQYRWEMKLIGKFDWKLMWLHQLPFICHNGVRFYSTSKNHRDKLTIDLKKTLEGLF